MAIFEESKVNFAFSNLCDNVSKKGQGYCNNEYTLCCLVYNTKMSV